MYRAVSTLIGNNDSISRINSSLYSPQVRGIHNGKSLKYNAIYRKIRNFPSYDFNQIKQYKNNNNIIKFETINNISTFNYVKEKRIINEIILTLIIEKNDINKKIFFLDNTDYIYYNVRHYHDNLKELNETNTKLFINKKEYKYSKYFIPYQEGIYEIKLIIYIKMKNCSFMFYNCVNIISINITNFDTSDVTDMNKMFFNCTNLITLSDISKWNTSNVINMSWMFYGCSKLSALPDISNWNTNNINDITFVKEIDEGAFSKVYLTIKRGKNAFFATKAINKSKINGDFLDESKIAENEYKILKSLNHPNIVRLEEIKITQDYYFLVMEYINGGTLFNCLQRYKNKYCQCFPEVIIQYLMRQIIDAIKYIHSKNIIHNDIRLDNIMVNFDNAKAKLDLDMMKARIKIIDFGLSSIYTTSIDLSCGLNMEQIILDNYVGGKTEYDYNSKKDILPLGTICYAMLTGEYPSNENKLFELIKKIESGVYKLPINISKEYLSFLYAILQNYSANRLKADQLSRHPFLTKKVSEFIKLYPGNDYNNLNTDQIYLSNNNSYINIQWY